MSHHHDSLGTHVGLGAAVVALGAAAGKRRLSLKFRKNLVRQLKVGEQDPTGTGLGDSCEHQHSSYELDDIHYISESDNNSEWFGRINAAEKTSKFRGEVAGFKKPVLSCK